MQRKMKEKKLHWVICLVSVMLMTACSNEVDKIVVPIHHTTDNLHTTAEDIDMPSIEVIPDTKLRFKDSKVVLEKKF